MKPLRIDFDLETPIRVPNYPIHLDGVIAWAAVQEGLETGRSIEESQAALPLAKFGSGDAAVWKASWIDFSAGPRDTIAYIRAFRLHDVVMDGGRVYPRRRMQSWDSEVSSSAYKAYLLKAPIRYSHRAHAWCVGDKDAIEGLLRAHVTHLGKLSRLDLGRIRSFRVSEDATAHEMWAWRTLAEPRPGYAQTYETVRPPYWKREQRRVAWVPLQTAGDFRKNCPATAKS